MALTDRERRIVEQAADIIRRDTSPLGEVEASLHAMRKIMIRKGMTLAELMGLVGGNETVQAIAAERDQWRRQAEKLERQAARKLEAANVTRSVNAHAHATKVAKVIKAIMREYQGITTDGIAAELERRKVKTPSGRRTWSRMQVHRIMQRAGHW